MRISDKVNIIMKELDSQASSIPSYMEENYRQAIITALARIDKAEQEEGREIKIW